LILGGDLAENGRAGVLMKLMALAVLYVGIGYSQSDECDTLDKCREAVKTNRRSSLLNFRIGEIYFKQGDYLNSASEFRATLILKLQPKWTEVWAHINLGRVFDLNNQRDLALNEYRLALKTKDNTRGALDEARKYTETPYRPN